MTMTMGVAMCDARGRVATKGEMGRLIAGGQEFLLAPACPAAILNTEETNANGHETPPGAILRAK